MSNFWSLKLSRFYTSPWEIIIDLLGCQMLVREKALVLSQHHLAPEGADALFWLMFMLNFYPTLSTLAVNSLQEGRVEAWCSPEGVVFVEDGENKNSNRIEGRHRFAYKCCHIPMLWPCLSPWGKEPPWYWTDMVWDRLLGDKYVTQWQ